MEAIEVKLQALKSEREKFTRCLAHVAHMLSEIKNNEESLSGGEGKEPFEDAVLTEVQEEIKKGWGWIPSGCMKSLMR